MMEMLKWGVAAMLLTLFATAQDRGRQMGYRGWSPRLAGRQVAALQTDGENEVRMRRP